MKVYLIREEDITHLLTLVDRNPSHGSQGGSSAVLTDVEKQAHDKAHRFYNYQVIRWIEGIKRE